MSCQWAGGVNVDTLRRARSKQEFTPAAISGRNLLIYYRYQYGAIGLLIAFEPEASQVWSRYEPKTFENSLFRIRGGCGLQLPRVPDCREADER